MTNEEIRKELQETIINLYNCTDDAEMKSKLNRILNGNIILRCKCPECGHKFPTEEGHKLSERIL